MIDTSDTYIYFIIALLPLSACMLVLQTNPYNALLAITLYAIAVRSSMILRLGVLEEAATEANKNSPELENLVANIRAIFTKRHMRLELVKYTDTQALQHGLKEKEVHAICVHTLNKKEPLKTITRLQRIYDIMQAELSSETTLTYVNTSDLEANINEMDLRISRDSVVR
jgi:putative multicomponent Na+:H+ antiporter subunit B